MRIKFIFSLICLVALAGFISCDDDDDNVSIVGTWQGDKSEIKGFLNGVPFPLYQETDEDYDDIIEFKDDNTVTVDIDGDVASGTWNWVEKNKKISVNIDLGFDFIGTSEVFTVNKLTATELELYLEKSGTFENPETNDEFDGRFQGTIYLKRI